MKRFKIGIDNYGLFPLNLTPLETLEWARDHEADGVAFSGLKPEHHHLLDDQYLLDLTQFAKFNGMYLEWGGGQHIPRDMNTWSRKEIFEINRKAAREAKLLGTRIVRSCSGGLMRWNPESPMTEAFLIETAKALKNQRQMLRDHNVILAIETHFEFTTFELRRLFEMCDAEPGDYLGICLDTMNILTMLEDPLLATERILPWVVSTHIKDGAVRLSEEGLYSYPVEVGKGQLDLGKILLRLSQLNIDINLSIEDHGGEFLLPIFDSFFVSRFPDLTPSELVKLIRLSQQKVWQNDKPPLAVTPRDTWPQLCETRIRDDLDNLRKLGDRI